MTGKAARRHALALLALLATSHSQRLSRDRLIGYLWPESGTSHARNLLNQSVHALRQALGNEAIRSEGEELVLSPESLSCDVWSFEEALASGEAERALALYRGPFLDGFSLPGSVEFERWADAERERLRQAHLKAMEQLAEAATARDDLKTAADWWRGLAAQEPYNSNVILSLMRVLEVAGDRAGAIREAEAHTERLREDLDAAPNPAVSALAERMRTQPIGPRPLPDEGKQHPASQTTMPKSAVPVRQPTPRPLRMRVAVAGAALALLAATSWAVVSALQRDSYEVRRLAVLPLTNMMGDPQQDYYVDGLHDALVTELAKIASLTVISRQSVNRYRDSDEPLNAIAHALDVEALVEGSVFLASDSVRITVQLVRADPEEHLWAETYYGDLRDALALQGEVAHAIARAIDARVAPPVQSRPASRRRTHPEAQEAYLRGLYELEWQANTLTAPSSERRATLRGAIGHLEEAIALDPEWAAAHAKLSLAYHFLASGSSDKGTKAEFYTKAKAAALRALDLDPTEAQAHASLGFVLLLHEWDWSGSEREIRQALSLEPSAYNHGIYAIYLVAAGRYDDAIAHYRLAEERNPLSDALKLHEALTYACAGRHDEAIRQYERLRARLGDDTYWLRLDLAHEYMAKGRLAEALAELEAAVDLSDQDPVTVAALAYGYARAGRLDEARSLMRGLEKREPPTLSSHPVDADRWLSIFPALHAALGETDRAVALVEEAFKRGGRDWAPHFRCSWAYQELRTEPRFQAIVRRIGFPE